MHCRNCRSSTRRTLSTWSRDCKPSIRLNGTKSISPTKKKAICASFLCNSRFVIWQFSFVYYCTFLNTEGSLLLSIWNPCCFSSDRNSCCFQMGELKARHEAMKQEQEMNHSEQLEGLKQQYEMSLEGNLVLRMDVICTFYLNLEKKKISMNDSDCMTDLCYRVLHFQIYFWCHNICNLFRSQQNLHTPAAGSGERYERDRSCFICKFNLPHIQESKRMSDEHSLNLPCGENTAETD